MMSVSVRGTEMFAQDHDLSGLSHASLNSIREKRAGYSVTRGRRFLAFRRRIEEELLRHEVITNNRYTGWFKEGQQTREQLQAFVVQFSVFSNLFLVAQTLKMINADSLDAMRASKEILANEIGVTFCSTKGPLKGRACREANDPNFLGTEGTVQGGIFRFEAGHFEWLLQVGEKLGLSFNEIGKRRFATPATLFFCDELARLYGSEDYSVSQAASYAVENWAAAGFWQELIDGLKRFNERNDTDIPLGFFAWHNRLEAQHAQHTQEELEQYYFETHLDEDAFLKYGNEMLDGVAAFWNGLESQRLELERDTESLRGR